MSRSEAVHTIVVCSCDGESLIMCEVLKNLAVIQRMLFIFTDDAVSPRVRVGNKRCNRLFGVRVWLDNLFAGIDS